MRMAATSSSKRRGSITLVEPIRRPTPRFVFASPAHFIALGLGTGLSPVAPGTVGSLVALPLYAGLVRWLTPAQVLLLVPVLFVVGIWTCGRTGRDLGVTDHGSMNWDEIVAMLLVLAFTPGTWRWQAAAFFLFRLFDVWKPQPVRYYDRTMKGGFGVMLDDLLAAGYTLLALAFIKVLVR